MAKKIYGIHFAGLWVDQETRVVVNQGEGDGMYCPTRTTPDGYLVPTEYAVASSPKVATKMFLKYFDFARRKYDPTRTLVLVCEPTVVEYALNDVLTNPTLKSAVCESCMAAYYGWDEENVAIELANALQGKARYEELF